MASFYVENFGCRATQADGAAIERQFEERGLERADAPAQAEVVVVNTCTVTAAADQDARAAIRRIHRANPGCQIVVTGCYAQRAPGEIAALPGVAQVIGNSHKHQLARIALTSSAAEAAPTWKPSSARLKPGPPELFPAELFASALCPSDDREGTISSRAATSAASAPALAAEGTSFVPLASLTPEGRGPTPDACSPIFVSDIFAHTELLAAPVFDAANERTRPNLKVQDGCDNRCSFCVIPYVRGQSRSLPLDEVLREVNALVEAGYREVVISGINLGRWGRDLALEEHFSRASQAFNSCHSEPASAGEESAFGQRPTTNEQRPRLEDLIRLILDCTSLEKLRISSIEPMDWSDELICLMSNSPSIAKHAHVPMQSGSDAVLRRMHRKYRPWHYREKIEKIRTAMPTAAIGADVMVGFPGETDAEFEETRRMVEDLPFTYLHVFTYSSRPGTPAADIPNQVPVRVARERNRILRELAAEKKLAFMRSFLRKTIEAITLNSCHPERSEGPMHFGQRQNASQVPDLVFTDALTDNYLKLRLQGRHQANRWLTATVDEVEAGALVGKACA